MATIKISDLHSHLHTSISSEEEFIEFISNAVIRAIDARQLQDIRGGVTLAKPTIIYAGFKPISQPCP